MTASSLQALADFAVAAVVQQGLAVISAGCGKPMSASTVGARSATLAVVEGDHVRRAVHKNAANRPWWCAVYAVHGFLDRASFPDCRDRRRPPWSRRPS